MTALLSRAIGPPGTSSISPGFAFRLYVAIGRCGLAHRFAQAAKLAQLYGRLAHHRLLDHRSYFVSDGPMIPLRARLQAPIERVRKHLDVQGSHASNMEEIWWKS